MDVRNLWGVETLARRIQPIEEAHHENPEAPSWDGAEFFIGTGERNGGALLAPSLRRHVAEELVREAAILKEKRKAREAKGPGKK